MIELPSAIPDVRVMLALEPEELGAKMLFLLRGRKGVFNYSAILDEPWSDHFSGRPKYPPELEDRSTGCHSGGMGMATGSRPDYSRARHGRRERQCAPQPSREKV